MRYLLSSILYLRIWRSDLRMRSWRHVLLRLFGVAVLLGCGGGIAFWWYHTSGADYQLRRGREALRRGAPDKAEQLADQLEAAGHPDHAHFLRGEVFLREGRPEKAVSELNQIREESESVRLEAGVVFGLGFYSLGRLYEAEHLLQYVLSKQPDNVQARRGLAALYLDQGAKSLAVIHAREWARLAPRDGHACRLLGVLYSDFGDSNAWAIASFREALSRDLSPQLVVEVKEELAEVLIKQTEYAEALQVLTELDAERAATQKPTELRAECLWGLGKVSELMDHLDRGLASYPRSVPLLRLRGQALSLAGQPQAATVPLEQALQIERHDHGSRYLLAQAYESLGRRAEAAEHRRWSEQTREHLTALSDLGTEAMDKPWDVALRLRMAEICEKLEKYQEAALLRKAAAACPRNPNQLSIVKE